VGPRLRLSRGASGARGDNAQEGEEAGERAWACGMAPSISTKQTRKHGETLQMEAGRRLAADQSLLNSKYC